jgi:hypothetical protein
VVQEQLAELKWLRGSRNGSIRRASWVDERQRCRRSGRPPWLHSENEFQLKRGKSKPTIALCRVCTRAESSFSSVGLLWIGSVANPSGKRQKDRNVNDQVVRPLVRIHIARGMSSVAAQ